MSLDVILAAILAGAVASALRYLSTMMFRPNTSALWRDFPLGIAIVNVLGSFIAGWATGLITGPDITAELYAVIIVGFCGGLTTMSTFSVDTIEQLRHGKYAVAAINVVGTMVVAFAALQLGFFLGGGVL